MTMEAYVQNVVSSSLYRSIRRSLPTDTQWTLAAAFIARRVHYCNGVLYGVSSQVIRRLQMVLNGAARLVVGVRRYEHITPALCDVLHWLPVPQLTNYGKWHAYEKKKKKCHSKYSSRWQYLHLTVSVSTVLPTSTTSASQSPDISGQANLHSAECHDMLVPSKSTQFGRLSFHVAATAIWNALPPQLRYHPLAVDSLELGSKPISSHSPIDSSENFCFTFYHKDTDT